ncbi:MAG: response regulator [Deltaproteobacteria bacterium]|nr:response regulator [Deltaproteobacteria bacterium]
MGPRPDDYASVSPLASSFADDERAYRFARIQSALLIVALGMLVFVVLYCLIPRPRAQIATGVLCAGVLASRAWARKPPRGALESLPLNLAIGLASTAVVTNALFIGGTQTYIQYYLLLVPAFAACLMSVRGTFLWTLAAAAGFVFIRTARDALGIDPTPLHIDWETLVGQTTLVLMVFGAALSQWTTTAKHVEGLQMREAMIRRQAAELEAARDVALRASEVKNQFLATVSHEIRTPMNAVIGLADVVLETKLDEEQRSMMETIRGSGEMLLGILNDILDFSKIESGRIELEHRALSVRDCIEDSLELLASLAAERKVELVYDHPRSAPSWIFGDPVRMRQIVMNLVSNAIKFTSDGEVIVSVRSGSQEGEPGRIRIVVRDTGIGIPAARLGRLFQPFSQVDASTTRRFGGTGLGLAITRRLVERMGGEVTVESEPGRGSEFTVVLPAEDASEEAGAARFDIAVLRARRLLAVLPHAVERALLERDGRDSAMTITCTASLDEACRRLRDGEAFDAVLVDARALRKDAAATLEEVRQRSRAPLVLLAGPGEGSDGAAVDEIGVFTVRIRRPLRAKRLAVALAALWTRADETRPTTGSENATGADASRRSLRILVAEDNLVNQRVARLMLGKLGYEADVVSDGVRAVEAFRRRPYDLVLMNVQMPEMDGLDATRAIRTFETGTTRSRIVALTANAMVEDRKRCSDAGMDDFLAKPLSIGALKAMIERHAPGG